MIKVKYRKTTHLCLLLGQIAFCCNANANGFADFGSVQKGSAHNTAPAELIDDSYKTLWTYNLHQPAQSASKNLFLESDANNSEALLGLVGTFAGKGALNAEILFIESDADTITAEFVLTNPDLKGNRTTSTLDKKTFSLLKSNIAKNLNGESITSTLSIIRSSDKASGGLLRTLIETGGTQTKVLDETAPIVDIISFLYLMRHTNMQDKPVIKQPLYFYLQGLLRKVYLNTVGAEKLTLTDGSIKDTVRYDLLREGDVLGSIWVAKKSAGTNEPLKIKIGNIVYLIHAKS